jgi:DUF4097 and DUF4098 domain-containing protein YvlB
MTRRMTFAALLFFALHESVFAQVQIDRRRPAPARGEVAIESSFGSVTVHGWDKREVLVQGTLAAGAEELSFEGDKEETSISVSVPEQWLQANGEDPAFRTTLQVFVPAGSHLSVRTVNAAVEVEAVTGRVEVSTVNGGVRIAGAASEVEVETMTGPIEVHALAAPMSIHSISGAVLVEGATGEVRIETVSGTVHVNGSAVSSLEVQTTTGEVEFRGGLARQGALEIETFSSPVRLVLPRSTPAVFDLRTFAGNIKSDFCAGTPVIRQRFEPFRELHCSTGPDDFEIRITTHDADISLAAE